MCWQKKSLPFLLCITLLRAELYPDGVDILGPATTELEDRGAGRCGGGSVLLNPTDVGTTNLEWILPEGWPIDFSILVVLRPLADHGTIFTVYDAGGLEQISLELRDASLVFMYQPPDTIPLSILYPLDAIEQRWYRLGLSVKGDAATLIVDCDHVLSEPLERPKNTTISTDGIVIIGQPLLQDEGGLHENISTPREPRR
ncbi:collagen alpha-2(XI) chain-like isoform X2 [Cimex lectularius]|uniref:Thrombospondin-like N-terminal domain-containing protein n=1 Tax=Cimex lectularius TaxID=79782 RepID=A0A8I6RP41_CIMLE|nr:collagen alpha-2(XI) chain-like isoform X2 [Cimex lectularius]